MKTGKRALPLFLAMLLLLGMLGIPAAAADTAGTMRITFRIEGVSQNLFYGAADVPYTGALTVQAALTYIDEQNESLAITGVDAAYITDINGDSAGIFGGWDGWLFEVNGAPAAAGIDATALKDGDEVLLYFGDPFGKGMQFPQLDLTYLRNGYIKVYSEDTVYDANWIPAVEKKPVVGATITWYTDDGSIDVATDAGGKAVIAPAYLTEGSHRIQIAKPGSDAVNGRYLPMVLRLAPDAAVTVSPAAEQIIFSDVNAGGWSADYIYDLVNLGVIGGRTPTSFDPKGNITRAEVAKMLAAASGEDLSASVASAAVFTDVAADSWYASYVGWTYDKGIVNGTGTDSFSPSRNITRQDLAVMLARFAAYKGYTLPNVNEAKAFADAASIALYAADAVSSMQQAGIIGGKSADLFAPRSFATREETAKMISLLLRGMDH